MSTRNRKKVVPMANLPLPSLEIRNFRAFQHLTIPRLGQINLVTGKNNVGKTCLLEAIWLYASRGSLLTIRDLLESRNETMLLSTYTTYNKANAQVQRVRFLFQGRHEISGNTSPISIGPVNEQEDTLSMRVSALASDGTGIEPRYVQDAAETAILTPVAVGLDINLGGRKVASYPLNQLEDWINDRVVFGLLPARANQIPFVYISASGLAPREIEGLWDRVALTDREQAVLDALCIVAPGVDRINLIADQERGIGRIPVVKVSGINEPVPLRSLGEGMVRLFGIGLALANVKDGFLLIDEADSGLHYTVHESLWKLIFQTAAELNVQVFATTHSWDCIEGFQKAAQEHTGEGLLVRLQARGSNIIPTLFNEDELKIVTRDDIEVR